MKRNKMVSIIVSIILVLSIGTSALFAACSPQPTTTAPAQTTAPTTSAVKPIVLRWASHFPDQHVMVLGAYKPFMQKVEQRTGGRVKFEWYPNATLMAGPDFFKGVQEGAAEIADMVYAGGNVPWHLYGQIPGLFTDDEVVLATEALYKSYIGKWPDQAWQKLGLKPLIIWEASNRQLGMTKKSVATANDLKGLKVRTSGDVMAKTFESVGSVPVSMPITDAYDALQKGVVDAVALETSSFEAYAFYEMLKFFNADVNLGGWPQVQAMNLKTFNSLPSDIQKIFMDTSLESALSGAETQKRENQKSLAKWKQAGMNIQTLSAADQAKIQAAVAPVRDWWVARMEKEGFPMKSVVDEWVNEMNRLRQKKS